MTLRQEAKKVALPDTQPLILRHRERVFARITAVFAQVGPATRAGHKGEPLLNTSAGDQ